MAPRNTHGRAGGSAQSASRTGGTSWAVGARGERQTGDSLAALTENDPHLYVFHDCFFRGHQANADHILIRGNRVLILDTKQVKAGWYWTLFGVTRRGLLPATHLDKQGSQLVQRLVREAAAKAGLPASAVTTSLLLRPAGKGTVTCWAMRLRDGVKATPANSLASLVKRELGTDPVTDNSPLLAWAGALRKG